MQHIRIITRRLLFSLLVVTVSLSSNGAVFALDSSSTDGSSSATCSAPAQSSYGAGTHAPTGSDAGTFTYQCAGQYEGDWTNDYYVYYPVSNTRTLLNPDYLYDCTTGVWTMEQVTYNSPTGTYSTGRTTTTDPGNIATDCPLAQSSTTAGSQNGGGTGSLQTNAATTNIASASGPTNTGSSSTNTNVNATTGVTNANTLGLNNSLAQTATSGNALVLNNTAAGDATSGSVQNEANIINMLQSSSNALGNGNKVITFTDNINGDVNGDLLLDPSALSSVQPAAITTNNSNTNNNLTINNSTDAAINNNLNLNANSGSATVSNNTSGGSATSGSAKDIANVVNSIQSAVTAGKSFIGTININGNLNGDILLPANFIDELLADNIPQVNVTVPGPNSTTNTTNNTASNTTVTNTNNLGITNAVNATAQSGSANISNNTAAGNAKSGSATTSLTAFNLTGSKVIGANDIIVFVNVQGKWTGLIVNAPAGATAASLGGGITTNTTNTTANTTVNNNANLQINNTINAAAKTGDASVSSNTKAGDASSGDASTAVNLLNVENSSLDLSNWFGILFINVFGTWNGSFGINTSAGDPLVSGNSGDRSGSIVSPLVFSFAPHTHTTSATSSSGSGSNQKSTVVAAATAALANGNVLGDSASNVAASSKAPIPTLQATHSSFLRSAGFVLTLVILYIATDAYLSHRKKISR